MAADHSPPRVMRKNKPEDESHTKAQTNPSLLFRIIHEGRLVAVRCGHLWSKAGTVANCSSVSRQTWNCNRRRSAHLHQL